MNNLLEQLNLWQKNIFPEALENNTYQDGIIHAQSYLKISSKIMMMK
jgi:hypothetical protein